ncbi:MAG TPA: AbrB/MazE/SpoVT family DNA-binding domain-containing protein [Xanthobacteraceae bacterium]|nr:AbrB/MazE/SpoVT family DNA-binding domain-containing protein [Xanthobacteraceae bacterium]
MRAKIAKWGNSLGVRLPKSAVEAAGFSIGAEVDIQVQGRGLRLTRLGPSKRYRLDDLIAEMDRLGPQNRPEVVDWGPDVGAEEIDDDYSRGRILAPGRGSRMGRSQSDTRARTRRGQTGRRPHGS